MLWLTFTTPGSSLLALDMGPPRHWFMGWPGQAEDAMRWLSIRISSSTRYSPRQKLWTIIVKSLCPCYKEGVFELKGFCVAWTDWEVYLIIFHISNQVYFYCYLLLLYRILQFLEATFYYLDDIYKYTSQLISFTFFGVGQQITQINIR